MPRSNRKCSPRVRSQQARADVIVTAEANRSKTASPRPRLGL